MGYTSFASPSSPRIIGLKVNEDGLKNMRPYRVFKDNTARINHLDYSRDGRLLITSSDDDSMTVYDCDKATKLQTVNSKKYGVCLIHFADNNKSVIHASSKVDNTIRYLSIDNKQYLRYFIGHVKRVRSLSMSPVDDCFVSCAMDNTLKLWDLRVPSCQGTLNSTATLSATFDRGGLVFAIGVGTGHVKLYDIRCFQKGPFLTVQMPFGLHTDYTSMQFAPNNRLMVLGTRHDELYVLDSYEGRFKYTLRGHRNDGNLNLRPAFAPGSKHVFCGSTDGKISIYSMTNGEIVRNYHTDHQSPIENILFNPRYYFMSTACMELRTWLPTIPDQSSGHDVKPDNQHQSMAGPSNSQMFRI